MEEPRFLTLEEIETVLTILPKTIRAATLEAGMMAANQIRGKLRLQLREIKLKPSKLGKLREEIGRSWHRSIIDPGEPVGITAGEGIGGPTTQMTLSGFHQAGSSKNVGSGVDIIRELLNMSQVRKVENCTLHFIDKNLTFEEVLDLRHQIVDVTLETLVRRKAIIRDQIPPWTSLYLALRGMRINETAYYLHLDLDRSRLVSHGLTPAGVGLAIERLDAGGVLICVPSPSVEEKATLDIYLDEAKVLGALTRRYTEVQATKEKRPLTGVDETNAGLFYLQLFVSPSLDQFHLNGVPGITQVFPQNVRTLSVIRATQETDPPGRGLWKLWLDVVGLRLKGIPLTKVRAVLEAGGIEVVADPNLRDPEMPPHYVVRSGANPLKAIEKLLGEEEKRRSAEIQERRAAGEFFPVPVASPLWRAGNYVYAETNGSNLRGLLAHPLIDKQRTFSNNPNELFRVVGLEAARNFIIRDFYETILNANSYVSPRHVILLADFMTNQIPLSITSKGVSRQNRGAFSDASFEHAIEAFVKSATFGRPEEVSATSTCIFIGARCGFGTGIMRLSIDSKRLEEYKRGCQAVRVDEPLIDPALLQEVTLANIQLEKEDGDDNILIPETRPLQAPPVVAVPSVGVKTFPPIGRSNLPLPAWVLALIH